MSEVFSFRWGIPLLDGGHTDIPNFMLDNYAQAGVSRSEFLTIIHLARYQYESRDAECRPSVATVAEQMGYSVRGLQKVLAGLEKRGLLARRPRAGRTTIYDFTGFSRAVLEVSTEGVNPSSGVNWGSGVNPSSGVGVNPSSPEEEKTRRKEEEKERPVRARGKCGRTVPAEGCLGNGSVICVECDLLYKGA
jgi:DNA-binding MarR family transcriptional regulator